MEHELVAKLTRALSKPPRNEKDVVYILVEIRKLLEHRENGPKYPCLRFFADWALHVKMDHKAAQELLARMDAELDAVYANELDIRSRNQKSEANAGLKRTPTLDAFYNELRAFLEEVGIHKMVLLHWRAFLKHYGQVVHDCPLLVHGRSHRLKHIDEVSLVYYRQRPKALRAAGVILARKGNPATIASNSRALPTGVKIAPATRWAANARQRFDFGIKWSLRKNGQELHSYGLEFTNRTITVHPK